MNPFIKALQKIEQMSDPGSYEKAIIEMKSIATNALSLYSQSENESRFKKPTDEQVVKAAIVFNDRKIDNELTNMVGLCYFVIDRLYENGDILIPSSKEQK